MQQIAERGMPFRRRVHRVGQWAALLAVATVALVTGAWAASAAAQPAPPTNVPDSIASVLPAGATIRQAQAAQLTGGDREQWIVLYDAPPLQTTSSNSAVLAIVTTESAGTSIAATIAVDFTTNSFFEIVNVDGVPAVTLSSLTGPHQLRLDVLRWDGAGFVTVFADSTNAPGVTINDLDGDAIPEIAADWSPYCGGYAISPRLVFVYRWNGMGFEEATAAYPWLLMMMAADFQAAFATVPPALDPTDVFPCLHDALAWLYGNLGDRELSAFHCNAAGVDVPERTMLAEAFCRR